MAPFPEPLDLKGLKVLPLANRQSLSRIEEILVDPALPPPPCPRAMHPSGAFGWRVVERRLRLSVRALHRGGRRHSANGGFFSGGVAERTGSSTQSRSRGTAPRHGRTWIETRPARDPAPLEKDID